MLAALKKFVSEFTQADEHPQRFDDNDYRLAATALLVHAASIDGNISDIERDKLSAIIKRQFSLSDADTEELVAEATKAENDAVDLYHFTSRISRALDEPGRRRIIEMLWEVVYADHHVGEFEDNLIWRVADLLGVSARERIELRQQVAGNRDAGTE